MNRVACFLSSLLAAAPLFAQTAPASAPAPAPVVGDQIVATFGGTPILRSELETFLRAKLVKVRQQEYDVLSQGLRDYAFKLAQEREAARQGVTVDALYRKNVIEKAGEPSAEEIDGLLSRYRSQLSSDPDQARKQVVSFLRERRIQDRAEAYRNELLAGQRLEIRLEPPRAEIAIAKDDPTLGPATAPVTVVEFSDFQCPYCQRGNVLINQIRAQYPEKVRFVFKQLPLPMHPQARFAAQAALCANQQGKYWELREWMFANQSKLVPDALKAAAKDAHLDGATFAACLDSGATAARVDADMAEATDLGATGTPTFFVNGRLLEGAQRLETFREVIDQELARPAAQAAASAR